MSPSLPVSAARRSAVWITILVCIAATAYFVVRTWSWPFMGDSGFIHYLIFLTRHGMAPYRDIVEINTPGAYIAEKVAMTIFGGGALGWRLFDLSLLALIAAGYITIFRKDHPAAGILAATLLILVHGQDGVMVVGERDLVAAALQVVSVAFLLLALEHDREPHWSHTYLCAASGFLLSAAACIKPPDALTLAAVLLWLLLHYRSPRGLRTFAYVSSGAILPILLCYAYLLRYKAVHAYLHATRGVMSYHLSLDRKSAWFTASHAFSPVLLLTAIALPLAFFSRRALRSNRELLLLLCAAAGLLSYIFQGKGFPYQRYPFLVFLLPLLCLCIFVPQPRSQWIRLTRAAALCIALGSICICAQKAGSYSHLDPDTALLSDLTSLGATRSPASIQCLDMIGGCIETLYKAQLVQSTGFLYDCYFEDDRNPTARALRSQFAAKMTEARPDWIVETNSSCLNRPRTFDKFSHWDWFNNFLNSNYKLVLEHDPSTPVRYWSRASVPFAYRIYEKNQPAARKGPSSDGP